MDIFIGTSSGKQDELLFNDGDANFTVASGALPIEGDRTHAAESLDVDGDGDPDLIRNGVSNGGQDRLLLNDGTGTFSDSTADLPPGYAARSVWGIGLGDVDGDADPDLFVTVADWLELDALYLNDGSGFFTEALGQVPTFEGSSWEDAAAGDFDGDGDMDVLLGAFLDARRSQLLVNDGLGRFRLASNRLPSDPEAERKSFALGDLDGDGDVDAFVGNPDGAPNLTWRNVQRQLHWLSTPRIGKPMTLETYGEPGAPWALASAAGPASIITAIGLLRLDPATIVLTEL